MDGISGSFSIFHFDGSLILVLIAFYFVGGCVAFYGGIGDT
jgi:hypothetical protein